MWHLMIFIIHKVFNNNKLIFNFFFKASIYYHSKERGRAAKSLGLKWTLGAELSGLPYYPAPPIPNNVLQQSSAQNGLSQEKTCLSSPKYLEKRGLIVRKPPEHCLLYFSQMPKRKHYSPPPPRQHGPS